jgi:hypothetical protein
MNDGFKVEYSADGQQVCIIPNRTIPSEDFFMLSEMYVKLGYKWWLPSDVRGGYILSKENMHDNI